MRAQRRQINRNVQYDNRLTTFIAPQIKTYDLHVGHDMTIGGDLDVSGNLKAKAFYASDNFYLQGYVLIPAGTIIQSAAVNVPGGWLSCNGASLHISDYQALFNAIQYTYGGGEDMFMLPDMRGRVAVGVGNGAGLSNRQLGASAGEETHTLTVGEIPSHTHALKRRMNDGTDAYDPSNSKATESSACTTDREFQNPINFNTYSTGGSGSHNNMQPYLVLQYLIKY